MFAFIGLSNMGTRSKLLCQRSGATEQYVTVLAYSYDYDYVKARRPLNQRGSV